MLSDNEDLLQFIWRHRLLMPGPLVTTSGREISVIHPGELNVNSGPDFFNAMIKVDDVVLAGNIEIHCRTSDWLRHNHQHDRSYDHIILHVVFEHDVVLRQNTDHNVEVLELRKLVSEETLLTYSKISGGSSRLPCSAQISGADSARVHSWMGKMINERMENKVGKIAHIFNSYNGDYVQTFYTLLLRNFGFNTNTVPFELLARQLPSALIIRHADNREQLEALLLGMSGMLDEQFAHPYILKLQNEFEFLKSKYGLIPLQGSIFKYSRLRPSNFPNLRLVQFASLVNTHHNILSSPHQVNNFEEIMGLLDAPLTGYWKNHYLADGDTLPYPLQMGRASAENIIINTFAPFFMFYAGKLSAKRYATLAFELLDKCGMENNNKTRLFSARKEIFKNAACSQGIIHLYDQYCTKKACLRCGIAAAILKPGVKQNLLPL